MPNLSPFLGLKEPLLTEKYNVIQVTNYNSEIVDNFANGINNSVDVLRTVKTTTGTASAYILDTDGTFDQTRDGNMLSFISHVANSGACTLTIDGQTTLNIKVVDDTGAKVDPDASVLGLNKMNTGYVDVANGFFVLAPKGGATILKSVGSIYTDGESATATTTRTTVNGEGFLFSVKNAIDSTSNTNTTITIDGSAYLPSTNVSAQHVQSWLISLFTKFNTQFIVKSALTKVGICYALGKKIETSSPKFAIDSPSTGAVSSRITVSGKGYITGFYSESNISLIIDGVQVIGNSNTVGWTLAGGWSTIWRFNTGFTFYTGNSVLNNSISYQLE